MCIRDSQSRTEAVCVFAVTGDSVVQIKIDNVIVDEHIDVYKRQAPDLGSGAVRRVGSSPIIRTIPIINFKRQTTKTVSYTHLDVYKRQLFTLVMISLHNSSQHTTS